VITARALGVLMEIASKELYGGAKALSEVFVEGRDACQKSLNELKAAGLTRTTKQKYSNGAYRSIIEITPAGWDVLETRISEVLKTRSLCIQSQSYSRLSTNSLYADKQERVPDVVGEETFVKVDFKAGGEMTFLGQMDNDPDEVQERIQKDRARRASEYQEAKLKKHQDSVTSLQSQSPALWSADKSSTEFVRRLEDMWHVKPWTVAKSRFKIAFANARKTHGTDGELELLMMDRYFSQLAHETHINDPEHIWKRFISQFGSLAIDCRRANVTDEDLETAKVSAEKSWEGI
jgi:DNA-binding PadR family transcriptional regulator